jgi:hypothetical protein
MASGERIQSPTLNPAFEDRLKRRYSSRSVVRRLLNAKTLGISSLPCRFSVPSND